MSRWATAATAAVVVCMCVCRLKAHSTSSKGFPTTLIRKCCHWARLCMNTNIPTVGFSAFPEAAQSCTHKFELLYKPIKQYPRTFIHGAPFAASLYWNLNVNLKRTPYDKQVSGPGPVWSSTVAKKTQPHSVSVTLFARLLCYIVYSFSCYWSISLLHHCGRGRRKPQPHWSLPAAVTSMLIICKTRPGAYSLYIHTHTYTYTLLCLSILLQPHL